MKDYIKQIDEVQKQKTPVDNCKIKSLESFQQKLSEASVYLSERDPILRNIIKKVGECRIKPHNKYFETLVDAILSQQLSLRAAETILNRFKLLFLEDGNAAKKRRFPLPAQIIGTDAAKLRGCGLSNAKVKYVKDLSAKVLNGTIKIHRLNRLTDNEIISELVCVKGIGIWTAQMFLIFCLGRLDVLPVDDLGFKKAVMLNYNLRKMPDVEKIMSISQKFSWQPFRSVASWYLWQSLSLKNTENS
jgi:DNA-3-methyladenine glycosylase II